MVQALKAHPSDRARMDHVRGFGRDKRSVSGIIGSDGSLRHILEQTEQLASLPITVLITGESGTGKELLAQLLHHTGLRSGSPLVTVNCAALPETLVESELFGHEKGAFTGALYCQKGKFEQAHGGTLFLDEIGELPVYAQSKLLRALQDKSVARVGGHETIPVDVRLIAATNRRLEDDVVKGGFREDLYYRLKVVELHCPPLRERKADIPALAHHFIDRYSEALGKPVHSISPAAMQQLCGYDWPGNIRELENVIARSVALATACVLRSHDIHLPTISRAAEAHVTDHSANPDPLGRLLELCGLSATDLCDDGFDRLMRACERICLQSVLARTRNQKEAADALSLSPSKIHRLIKKHGLKRFTGEFQN